MINSKRFNRSKLLFGDENLKKFENFKIILFGVGGVGSFALDCLYRTGFQNITIVDYDIYDETNRNRQIGSDGNIGKTKIEVLKQLYPNIEIISARISPDWVSNFDFSDFDLVLDAIDDSLTKVFLAKKVSEKLISSMGSGQQSDSTQIKVISIWETENDPFARKIRKSLRRNGFDGDYPVVFSLAERKGDSKGSFIGVTGSFGLALCGEAVKRAEIEKTDL